MLHCVVLDDYQQAARHFGDWDTLSGRVETVILHEHLVDEALLQALSGADIVVAMRERTPFQRALLARLPRLKLLITTGMANASFDFATAAEQGVTICGTRGSAGSAAELAWALLMAVMRHLPQEATNLRSGGPWQTSVGKDLRGRTLGLVGLGRLGSRMARFAQAFEMPVIAWSPNLTAARASAAGASLVSKQDLFRQADGVAVQMVLSPATRGLVGAAELALMRRNAVLINTSRGPLVDEAALIAALRDGRIGGAGLDTFDHEPLPPDHPFRSLPNVVATPHLGYVTEESYRLYFADAIEDIEGWIAGTPPRVLA